MREIPAYALVVKKGGSKLKESTPQATFSGNHGIRGRNVTLKGIHYTMSFLADALNEWFGVDLPVVDRTGLAGYYDIEIEATPEYRIRHTPDTDGGLTDLTIFEAIQKQLGLRLEPIRMRLDIISVDSLAKPSPN